MRYCSTKSDVARVPLHEAVMTTFAADGGNYMPWQLPRLPRVFYRNIGQMSLQEMSFAVAHALFGDSVDGEALRRILCDSMSFDIPLVGVEPGRYALELFHGPTLSFKDISARFMAGLLSYYNHSGRVGGAGRVNVLVASSGDVGGAVAKAFSGMAGVRVLVLYPASVVSGYQKAQLATLATNVRAVEVAGSLDECQWLVRQALRDEALRQQAPLTCANSVNVARLLPQMFYYFYAYALLSRQEGVNMDEVVVSVPTGNLGNLTAGIMAKRMGLPIKRFVATSNSNDTFYRYLLTGRYEPRGVEHTLVDALDVGNPNNFDRLSWLYGGKYEELASEVAGYAFTDEEIAMTIAGVYGRDGYVLDPHSAVSYRGLEAGLRRGETGVALATTHPARHKLVVDAITGADVAMPARMRECMAGARLDVQRIPASYQALRHYLLSLQ